MLQGVYNCLCAFKYTIKFSFFVKLIKGKGQPKILFLFAPFVFPGVSAYKN